MSALTLPNTLEQVLTLKAEVDHFKDLDSLRAFRAGEQALHLAEESADLKTKAVGSWAYALGLTVQGRYAEAIPVFKQARGWFVELGEPVEAARVSVRKVQALAMSGDLEGALNRALEVRDIFAQANLIKDAATIENNVGIILSRLGQLPQAEAAFRRGLEGFKAVGDELGIAKTLANLAYVLQDQDRFREAGDSFQTALEIMRKHNQHEAVAGTTVSLALLYRREGRLTQSLDLLSRARRLYSELGGSPDAAYAQLEEARIHLDLNLLDEARRLSQELVEIFAARGVRLELAESRMVLGLSQVKAGKAEAAEAVLQAAHQDWLALGNAVQAAHCDLALVSLHLNRARKGDLAAAQEVVQLSQQASEVLAKSGIGSGLSLAQSLAAEALMYLGQLEQAEALLLQAESTADSLDIPDLVLRTNQLLGQVARLQQRHPQAEERFKETIERLESVRASISVDEFKAAYLGDKLSVYGELVGLLLEQHRPVEALSYAERAKSRALLDSLTKGADNRAGLDDPQTQQLNTQLQQTRQELNRHFLLAEREGPGGEHWARVKACEERITGLIRELERLQPETALLQQMGSSHLEALMGELGSTTLLEYFSIGENLVAFVVRGQEVQAINLGSLSEVQYQHERLRFFLSRVAQGEIYAKIYGAEALQKSVDTHLKGLYDLLLGPLALNEGQKLIVVPHGPLHSIPFSALFDGERYLIDQAQVSLAPSATIFGFCQKLQKPSAGPLVAFGVPIENIPQTITEVEKVTALFPGAKKQIGDSASLTAFFEQASQAQVLHIATHGAFRPDNPMFSGLRMSDGWLAARDLVGLRLQASLVVLSACETGLSGQDSGDEVMGLVRGFLYAGAPSLVTSLWPVQDQQTSQLMIAFYQHLKAGSSVAAALRSAQLEVRAEHPNPYYWSAFNLTGDPDRVIKE
jgi:tetratricopeptide (TPR) repeat protein